MKKLNLFLIAFIAMVMVVSCGQQPISNSVFNAKLENCDWFQSIPGKGDVVTENYTYNDKGDLLSEVYLSKKIVSDEVTLNFNKDKTFTFTAKARIVEPGTYDFKSVEKDGKLISDKYPDGIKVAGITLQSNTKYTIKNQKPQSETVFSGTWFTYKNVIGELIYVLNVEKGTSTSYNFDKVYDDTTKTFDFAKAVQEPLESVNFDSVVELAPVENYNVVKKNKDIVLTIDTTEEPLADFSGDYIKLKK